MTTGKVWIKMARKLLIGIKRQPRRASRTQQIDWLKRLQLSNSCVLRLPGSKRNGRFYQTLKHGKRLKKLLHDLLPRAIKWFSPIFAHCEPRLIPPFEFSTK